MFLAVLCGIGRPKVIPTSIPLIDSVAPRKGADTDFGRERVKIIIIISK